MTAKLLDLILRLIVYWAWEKTCIKCDTGFRKICRPKFPYEDSGVSILCFGKSIDKPAKGAVLIVVPDIMIHLTLRRVEEKVHRHLCT